MLAGEREGVDPRLAYGIAGAESTWATNPASLDSRDHHNAWGWNHPPGAAHGQHFDSWTDGIDTVTRGLAEGYIRKGLTTVERIQPVYVGHEAPGWVATVEGTITSLGGNPNALAYGAGNADAGADDGRFPVNGKNVGCATGVAMMLGAAAWAGAGIALLVRWVT